MEKNQKEKYEQFMESKFVQKTIKNGEKFMKDGNSLINLILCSDGSENIKELNHTFAQSNLGVEEIILNLKKFVQVLESQLPNINNKNNPKWKN